MNLIKFIDNITRDSMFFYFVVAISFLQIYKIFLDESLYCGAMFFLTALIMCKITTNKSLCLVAALLVTNFVLGCSKLL
jgi:hypothetical protein